MGSRGSFAEIDSYLDIAWPKFQKAVQKAVVYRVREIAADKCGRTLSIIVCWPRPSFDLDHDGRAAGGLSCALSSIPNGD
jgi:hypothetical protein